MCCAVLCCPVYPRACGGTTGEPTWVWTGWGLSPRLRGNLNASVNVNVKRRSIPAPAGEPQKGNVRCKAKWVYPRACGGTAARPRLTELRDGLSPRLRGNRTPVVDMASRNRSIPAPAGEPTVRSARPNTSAVYPRACGGTWRARRRCGPAGGLSPRLRGNLLDVVVHLGQPWSIPAPAGEPPAARTACSSGWVYPRACGGTLFSLACAFSAASLSPRLRGNPRNHLVAPRH